jgi:hypothetical protein
VVNATLAGVTAPRTAFTAAVSRASPFVQILCESDRLIKSPDVFVSAAFSALQVANVSLMFQMIDLSGGDINLHNNEKLSLFTVACRDSTLVVIDAILSHPSFDPVKSDFHQAVCVSFQRKDVFFRLMKHPGFDPHAVMPPVGKSTGVAPSEMFGQCLFRALAAKTCTDLIKAVLACPTFDVTRRDSQGKTPLLIAVQSSAQHIRQLLMHPDTDINAKDSTGTTALMLAVRQRQQELVSDLIDMGADLTLVNNEGKTAWSLGKQSLQDPPQDRTTFKGELIKVLFRPYHHPSENIPFLAVD